MSERHRHRRRRGRSRTRDTVSIVFSFFLALSLVGITVPSAVRFGLVTEGGILSIVDETYCGYVLDYVEKEATYYTMHTGIDPKVLEGVFTTDEIQANVHTYVSGALGGYNFEPDVDAPRERLTQNVRDLFASDGVDLAENTDAEEVVQTYVDEIIGFYASTMKPTGTDAIVKVYSLYRRYYPIAMVALVALATLLTTLLVRLHHFLHRSLRFVAYATGGAALMGFVVPFVLFASGYFKGLSVTPQYFYYFCVSLIERVLALCMTGSAVLLVLTVVLAIVIARMRKSAVRRHRS